MEYQKTSQLEWDSSPHLGHVFSHLFVNLNGPQVSWKAKGPLWHAAVRRLADGALSFWQIRNFACH